MLIQFSIVGGLQLSHDVDGDYDDDYDEPGTGAAASEQTQSQVSDMDTTASSERPVPVAAASLDQAATNTGKAMSSYYFFLWCHRLYLYWVALCSSSLPYSSLPLLLLTPLTLLS